MRSVTMTALICAVTLVALCTAAEAQKPETTLKAANGKIAESDYTNWFFIKSDKSLQYRMAIAKQEGDLAHLQLQFRVKADDEVHCTSPLCNGLLLHMFYRDTATDKDVPFNFIFPKEFTGTYTFGTLIPVEFKTWADGSKRYLSRTQGIVYTLADSPDDEQPAMYLHSCVDVRLTNSPDHRCREFSAPSAIVVGQ